MPKVSIVIPTYNVEQYLKECLDSVINQTLKDIEIICVDDGSTDNSGKILDEYAAKDSRIKVIHKENGGYGKAMNVGIDNATGEYIGIVEPDDYIEFDMYETLYINAKKNNVDIIKSDYYTFITENGINKTKIHKLISPDYYYRLLYPCKDIKLLHIMTTNWSGIYKKEFLNKYNIRHNESPGAAYQDNGFYIQTMYLAKNIYFMDKPFYHYRLDNPNQSIRRKNNIFTIPYEYKFIDNIFNLHKKELFPYRTIYTYRKYKAYMWHMKSRLDFRYWQEYLIYMQKEFLKHNERGELDPKYFPDYEWADLQLILNNLDEYLKKYEKYKVSVIIPIYNCEKYLPECLDSIIAQTVTDIEIICVDDCSTDNSLNILNEYAKKDSRIRVLALDKNGKQGRARNKALDIAKGEFVVFVDADDYLAPDAVEDLLLAANNSNADIVVANVSNFTGASKYNEMCNNFEIYYNKISKNNGCYNFNGEFMAYRSGPVAKLFKKSIIDKFNIRFPQNIINEDEAFHWAYFSHINNVYFLNKIIYFRRVHETSTMVRRDIHNERLLDMAYNMEIICKTLIKDKKMKQYKDSFLFYYEINKNAVLNRCASNKKEFKKAKKIFKKMEQKYYFLAGYNNPLERIFFLIFKSIHKIITIFGIKFKFKNKELIERAEKQRSQEQINNLNRKLDSIIKTQKINSGKFAELQSSLCTINDNVNEVQDSLREIFGIEQKFNLSFENFRESLKQNAATLQKNLDTISDCQNNQINTLNNKVNLNSTMLDELQYSVVLNQSWIDSEWVKNKSFSLRLGSSNYSFIYSLFKILDEIAPLRILEFGLGQTTKLTSQYVNNKNTNAALDIVEHDNDWINEFSGQITLTNNIKIYHKNLIKFEINGVETDKYDDLSDIVTDKKYDLIIIDGPFGFDRIYPRTNILDLIPNNLAENFVIILDDAERKGEQNTANLIFNKLDACNIQYEKSYKKGLKTQLIISSTNHKYIHWI